MVEHLWAGWRSPYIEQATSDHPRADEGGCVFCRILASGAPDEETHILWRDPSGRALALLNAYPYTSGHLMVMPLRHAARLDGLDAEEAAAVWDGVRQAVAALEGAYRPEGVNLGANLGRAAGAGVPDHLHFHALPRWVGDTNFTTAVADLRVLPEALGVSAAKLRAAWPL
ncbi:MAG: HIT family protein [Acidimicrobiales bacterium]